MLVRRPSAMIRMLVISVAVVCALGVSLTYLLAPLNGNLRYEAGAKLVGPGSAAAIFSHRPLGYRMIMDGVFRAADLVSREVVGFEIAVRVVLLLLALGASALLWRGLARRGVAHAGWYAIVSVALLIVLGPVSAGEPEWLAVVLTAGGIGAAALGVRRPWLWAVIAGALLVAAAAVKLVTLPVAIIGLLVVGLIDRRQALRTLVGCVVVGVLYVLVTMVVVPWELKWLMDIRSVQNDPTEGLPEFGPFLLGLVVGRPVLLALPVALVLAGARERIMIMVCTTLTVAMVAVQGQYFDYHAIPLVAVAGVVAFRVLVGRVSSPVGVTVVLIVVAGTLVMRMPGPWRAAHESATAAIVLVVATAAVLWALRQRHPRSAARLEEAPFLAAVIAVALAYPSSAPWSAHLLRTAGPDGRRPPTTIETRTADGATGEKVREVVGDAAHVTYLTFGEWSYFIRLPTSCRYPSPLFLQRTRKPARLSTASYAENLRCLSAADSAWLIIDPTWFRLGPQPAAVRATIEREWDCDAAVTAGPLRLCPRRTS